MDLGLLSWKAGHLLGASPRSEGMARPGERRSSDLLVWQERAQQFIVGTEWPPAGRWRRGEERCDNPLGALLMGFGGIADPAAECLADSETGLVVHDARPAIRETLGQHSNEHISLEACHLFALLGLGEQLTQYLHRVDVVLTELFCQSHQRDGWARFGKGGERSVSALADPLMEAHLPVPLPRTIQAPPR